MQLFLSSILLLYKNAIVSDNVLQMIGSSLTIASSIFVLISAWKNHKPMFLMPWLVIQAISFIAAVGYSIYCGIILSAAQEVQFAISYFIGCFIGAGICKKTIISAP